MPESTPKELEGQRSFAATVARPGAGKDREIRGGSPTVQEGRERVFQLSFLFQHKFQRKATHFVPALSMVAAYAVTGWLGLWLAIPPGYATAIWPASGLALAGVLMGGARVAPGIWLGSFVVNLWTAWDATHAAALLTSVAIPSSIG